MTLNRPERRNALSAQMTNELLYALDDAAAADTVRCTVLTGAGSAFCAGADLGELSGGTDALELPPKGGYDDLLRVMMRTTKPIIARVNGHAVGGGLGLVAASTLAIASTDAKLSAPEVRLGLFPFMIYAALERVMERRQLLELLLCGKRLSAEEAGGGWPLEPRRCACRARRHFADLEAMMQAIVEAFGDQLRQGLNDVRATLRPGEVPTQKVIGWLFDFASAHRDVFIVAMRERFGPPGPVRDAVHRLLEQLTKDSQRDLTMIGFLPDVDPDYMRRLLQVSVNEVFQHCIEYLEEPRRRHELLATTQELLETMLAGAVALDARARMRNAGLAGAPTHSAA